MAVQNYITPFEFICDKCLIKEKSYFLQILNSNEFYPLSFPVNVYNQSGSVIGTANTKQEYIDIWNEDATNQAVGVLSGWYGEGSVRLDVSKIPTQNIPGLSDIFPQLYLIDNGDGTYLKADINNVYLTYK